jgi:hypothetical protein
MKLLLGIAAAVLALAVLPLVQAGKCEVSEGRLG